MVNVLNKTLLEETKNNSSSTSTPIPTTATTTTTTISDKSTSISTNNCETKIIRNIDNLIKLNSSNHQQYSSTSTSTLSNSSSSITSQILNNNNNNNSCLYCIQASETNFEKKISLKTIIVSPALCSNPNHLINQSVSNTINSMAFKSTLRAKKVYFKGHFVKD